MNNYQVKVIRVLEETAFLDVNANTVKEVADEIRKRLESESIFYNQARVKNHKVFVNEPAYIELKLALE